MWGSRCCCIRTCDQISCGLTDVAEGGDVWGDDVESEEISSEWGNGVWVILE